MTLAERKKGYVKEGVIAGVFALAIFVVLAVALGISLGFNDWGSSSSNSTFVPNYAGEYVSDSYPLSYEMCLSTLSGQVPTWLNGTLFRMAPGAWPGWDGPNANTTSQAQSHQFLFIPMIHAYTFSGGKVNYGAKYLDSDPYRAAVAGVVDTNVLYGMDPYAINQSNNCNINIHWLGGEQVFLATMERTDMNQFDGLTLETLTPNSCYSWNGNQLFHNPALSTAHGQIDPDTEIYYNFASYPTTYRNTPVGYFNLYSVGPNDTMRTVRPYNISGYFGHDVPYQHSMTITQHYAIATLQPIFFPTPAWSPILDTYLWGPDSLPDYEPSDGWQTQFVILSLETGQELMRFSSPTFVTLHHVNAYEDTRTNSIVLDVVQYPSQYGNQMLSTYLLENVLHDPLSFGTVAGSARLYRYEFPLSEPGAQVNGTQLFPYSLEIPTIHYEKYNGRPYRYIYAPIAEGLSSQGSDSLAKIDVGMETYIIWKPDGNATLFCGEPVFVPSPNPLTEDDGVVIAGIFDSRNSTSFLVILDGVSFSEIARVSIPHLPAGTHGHFLEDFLRASTCT